MTRTRTGCPSEESGGDAAALGDETDLTRVDTDATLRPPRVSGGVVVGGRTRLTLVLWPALGARATRKLPERRVRPTRLGVPETSWTAAPRPFGIVWRPKNPRLSPRGNRPRIGHFRPLELVSQKDWFLGRVSARLGSQRKDRPRRRGCDRRNESRQNSHQRGPLRWLACSDGCYRLRMIPSRAILLPAWNGGAVRRWWERARAPSRCRTVPLRSVLPAQGCDCRRR